MLTLLIIIFSLNLQSKVYNSVKFVNVTIPGRMPPDLSHKKYIKPQNKLLQPFKVSLFSKQFLLQLLRFLIDIYEEAKY